MAGFLPFAQTGQVIGGGFGGFGGALNTSPRGQVVPRQIKSGLGPTVSAKGKPRTPGQIRAQRSAADASRRERPRPPYNSVQVPFAQTPLGLAAAASAGGAGGFFPAAAATQGLQVPIPEQEVIGAEEIFFGASQPRAGFRGQSPLIPQTGVAFPTQTAAPALVARTPRRRRSTSQGTAGLGLGQGGFTTGVGTGTQRQRAAAYQRQRAAAYATPGGASGQRTRQFNSARGRSASSLGGGWQDAAAANYAADYAVNNSYAGGFGTVNYAADAAAANYAAANSYAADFAAANYAADAAAYNTGTGSRRKRGSRSYGNAALWASAVSAPVWGDNVGRYGARGRPRDYVVYQEEGFFYP